MPIISSRGAAGSIAAQAVLCDGVQSDGQAFGSNNIFINISVVPSHEASRAREQRLRIAATHQSSASGYHIVARNGKQRRIVSAVASVTGSKWRGE